MLVMRTTERPADPVGELVGSQQAVEFDDPSFPMNPLGLDGVQPRALLGKMATHDPHPLAAVFDAGLCLPSHRLTSLETCQEALSQMRSKTFLPAASSSSQHHPRNCVVMELTGLPSTNLIHMSSRRGR